MTTEEAAAKYGVRRDTVVKLCQRGRIPGAERVLKGKMLVWEIPDDAERPKRKNDANAIEKIEPSPGIVIPLTMQEIEGHIRRFASTHSYARLKAELGLSVYEIRSIYDRLHARYGC